MNAIHILFIFILGYMPVSALALTLSQTPLFIASTEPRVMLVASRDHQLSMKAYTDYTDIDSNGTLDTTYNDGINYYGYFDSKKCYSYSLANSRFEPAATAGGLAAPLNHQCSGYWSGNFMNWASMTRMDVLRKTFYGGYRRSIDDTTGASAVTVLERQFLPVDVHAFSKVYNPGSAATLKLYIPSSVVGTNTAISLCNVSDTTDIHITGTASFTLPYPLIKIAAGSWPQWDSSEVNQCQLAGGTQPTALIGDAYIARVKVCDSTGGVEANCKTYTHPTTGVQTLKPVGLLQQYGDVDADRQMRFGLMTGSYAANKSGGVLRKNVGFIANNSNNVVTSSSVCGNNSTNDEIDVCTGQFINQGSNQAGIINTLSRMRIAGFEYTSSGGNGSYQYDCNSPGKLSFTDGQCVDWGNPLAETYLESLRYFANAGATTAFDVSDASILASIPKVSWTDPLPSAQWCALSSIIVLSTGLNSFDTNDLASFTPSGGSAINANTLTNTVGDASHEDINGRSYLIGNLIGGSGVNANNQCTAKTISALSNVKGICPEGPSIEGGYGVAGLAYAPKIIDLRPDYAAFRNTRWGDNPSTVAIDPINADWALRQPMNTYAVQLAETLPSFNMAVPVGTTTSVTLVPACQANSTASPGVWTTSSTGWRNCSMTNLVIDNNVAYSSVGNDHTAKTNTCSGNGTSSRCFTIAWEDSTWGNDYDMDGIQRLGYCVGSACSSFKMLCPSTSSAYATLGPWTISSNQIVIATCTAQANAGHALTFGYTLTGTSSNGAFFPILRQGGNNFNVGSNLASNITSPNATTYTQGAATASTLKNPLWYMAKYGSFTESTPATGVPNPNLPSEWDIVDNNTGVASTSTTSGLAPGDGIPDNYFNVRNPATLITALSTVFDRASVPDASAASVATNSTSLQITGRVFQAKFSSADWSGQLLSYKINTNGLLSNISEWDAGQIINSQTPDSRVILTKGASDGVAFRYANLTGPTSTSGTQKNLLDKNAAIFPVTDTCGAERVAYLRGDSTNEGATGIFSCASTTTISKFRRRNTSKLGDTVNSNPVYVGVPAAGFSDVDHPGYSAFRSGKLTRSPVVYVGSNDGMLHGFDASLDISSDPVGTPITNVSGKEKLAYLPSVVFPNLSKLTATSYNKNHNSFVDGSPMFADADLDSSTNNNWRTVLVGAMAAGGKGYYALDISDPASFSETTPAPANTLLWEFDETDMGYVYNMPPISSTTNQAKQIVKMANGKWAVIVGNGYNSIAGKAVLYILYIESGVDGTWSAGDFEKIIADAPAGLDNGLSTPIPFDSNNDGYADTVYAGDLKGNMWKFLVGPTSSDATVTSTSSTWKVAFSGSPLFIAKDSGGLTQPIIWPPEVTVHPNGGQMILFGTGKYIEPSDNTSTSVQTFYGIWDRDNGTTTLGIRAIELLQQTIANTTSLTGGSFRIPSANAINWRPVGGGSAANCSPTCTPTHMGWYIDLPSSKERTTGIPKLINNVIFFNTYIPSTAVCDTGGTGWLMSLEYLSGGLVSTHRVFDTSGNGIIDASDTQVGGYQVGAVLGGTTMIQNDLTTSNIGVGVSATTSGNLSDNLINFGGGTSPSSVCTGRCSWRELLQ
ncbi:MAG: PilC/PilY family type IV pilus protein [Methylobacter sp.]|nr:PilC/PilY family type IV pilus protein [Methylobacter sp.]